MIKVVKAGARTSVQNLGRYGLGAQGVPRGGAMDLWALRAANRLVGNDDGAAALEMTLAGPSLRFEADTVVAVVGARCDVANDEAFSVPSGDVIEVGRLRDGARAMLAVRGGIEHRIGETLAIGDVMAVTTRGGAAPLKRLRAGALRRSTTMRAVALQDSALFGAPWTLSADANRAGLRLNGARLTGGEIEPIGIVPGVVQVPPSGSPIVLGPDGPATGGYRAVACVIGADVGLLAYPLPGATITFEQVDVQEAHQAWHAAERALAEGIEDIA